MLMWKTRMHAAKPTMAIASEKTMNSKAFTARGHLVEHTNARVADSRRNQEGSSDSAPYSCVRVLSYYCDGSSNEPPCYPIPVMLPLGGATGRRSAVAHDLPIGLIVSPSGCAVINRPLAHRRGGVGAYGTVKEPAKLTASGFAAGLNLVEPPDGQSVKDGVYQRGKGRNLLRDLKTPFTRTSGGRQVPVPVFQRVSSV